VIEIDGVRVYDSPSFASGYRSSPRSTLLSSDIGRGRQRQLEDWSDESLYWYGMALRWTAKNSPATAAQIFAAVRSACGRSRICWAPDRSRAMTRAQGLGRLPADVLLRELGHRLDDLAVLLGDRPFFYSEQPSVADLAIYGQLHMLRSGPTPKPRH